MTAVQDPTTTSARLALTLKTAAPATHAATRACTPTTESVMMAGLVRTTAFARCTRIAPTAPAQRQGRLPKAAATHAHTLLMAIAMMAGPGLFIPIALMVQIAPTVEHATVRFRRPLQSLSVSAALVTMTVPPMRGPSNALPLRALTGATMWSHLSWKPAAATLHAMARTLLAQKRTSQRALFAVSAHTSAAPALERARTSRTCFPP